MKKQWIDPNGNEVPSQYVPKLDKERDRLAQRTLKKALDINKRLTNFKEESVNDCDALFEKMMAEHKVKKNGKGNYSISSFDKNIKIEISIQERVEFDDLIQVAQEKINEYIKDRTDGVDFDLQQIINLAFKTTKGRLDTKRVLSLFSLNITHKTWLEAMEILKKSIHRNVSKRYMRIWQKDKRGEYKAVELNFSSI